MGLISLFSVSVSILFFAFEGFANPYFKPEAVPTLEVKRSFRFEPQKVSSFQESSQSPLSQVVRLQVDWNSNTEGYQLSRAWVEHSGTPALRERVLRSDPHGSYQAALFFPSSSTPFAFQAIGTGKEYRVLARALTFRFPVPKDDFILKMKAENPKTGKMEVVLSEKITLDQLKPAPKISVKTRLLKEASKTPSLRVNIYAEGYLSDREDQFWKDATKTVEALNQNQFPMFDQMEFHAVFAPSQMALGPAKKLGFPIPIRESFLGLYFPYWATLDRWYHVIYPTSEDRYRTSIGQVPYDHPIVVVDDANYWGVGNFMSHTAIPARHPSFVYLLLHEFGHYFGLNEEYEGGGPTELEFAPGIEEPWSQNITFQTDREKIKWKSWIEDSTPVPTGKFHWIKNPGSYGAYRGGYADSEPQGHSHKPGLRCVMDRYENFCEICKNAIIERLRYDLGIPIKK